MSTDGQRTEQLSQQESLDEDNLRLDPLEEGVEPPERWAEADRFGTTAREQREGEDLDHRLAAEEPDLSVEATRPGADTPLSRLTDRIDEPTDDVELLVDEPIARREESADAADGSVAESLREESDVPYDEGDLSPDAPVRDELR